MIEYENSKSDDQLEELLLLTEQMQEELDQKDRTIEELRVQLDESLTLNERLNSENRAGNIQALKKYTYHHHHVGWHCLSDFLKCVVTPRYLYRQKSVYPVSEY